MQTLATSPLGLDPGLLLWTIGPHVLVNTGYATEALGGTEWRLTPASFAEIRAKPTELRFGTDGVADLKLGEGPAQRWPDTIPPLGTTHLRFGVAGPFIVFEPWRLTPWFPGWTRWELTPDKATLQFDPPTGPSYARR